VGGDVGRHANAEAFFLEHPQGELKPC
jgi:hypothetical protein